jgi:hypothetical protein
MGILFVYVCGQSGHTGTTLDSYLDLINLAQGLRGAKMLNEFMKNEEEKSFRVQCF